MPEAVVDGAVERLVVIADLHAYGEPLRALNAALAEIPARTQVMVCGDLFCGGLAPVETLDWVMKNAGRFCVLGNHDEGVIARPDGPLHLFEESGTAAALREDQLDYLEALPHHLLVCWRGYTFRLVHGHRDGNGEQMSWQASAAEQWNAFHDPDVDAVFLGHTHFPYVMDRRDTQMANPGSIALNIFIIEGKTGRVLPRGGWGVSEFPRNAPVFSSFLSVTEEHGELSVELVRFDFDREKVLDAIRAAGQTNMPQWERWVRTGVHNFG